MQLNSRTLEQPRSPIGTALSLLDEYEGERPIFDLSAGAPDYPTAPVIADHIAKVACEANGASYTARPGIARLRDLVSDALSRAYGGNIEADQVLITVGCNQAFCLTVSALASYGDEVILPVPYYFNHDMWLRLEGISPAYLSCTEDFVPDPRSAEALVSERTKAIVLVTPGNPTGVTIPPDVIDAFADISRKHNIALILDETYRAFRAPEVPQHALFRGQQWPETIVTLSSFSKEFAIPGHRVGAAIGHRELIIEMLKLHECMSICAPRLGQEAVIAALTNGMRWRDERVREILRKQERFRSIFADRPGGFELCASGAFFGWIRHSSLGEGSSEVVRRLLVRHGVLVLPGDLFMRSDDRYLRFSFVNLSLREIDELRNRLREFVPC